MPLHDQGNVLTANHATAAEIEAGMLPKYTSLWIYRIKGDVFPRIPENIRELKIIDCHSHNLDTIVLPLNLHTLSIESSDSLYLPKLPEGLKSLTILDSHFKTLPRLPESLTYIKIGLMYNYYLWDKEDAKWAEKGEAENNPEVDARFPDEPFYTFIQELWADNNTDVGWHHQTNNNNNIAIAGFLGIPQVTPFPSLESVKRFIRKVNDYIDYKEGLKEQYRGLLTFKQGLVVKPVNLANRNSSSEMTLGTPAKDNKPATQTFMHVGLPNEISSYLTGAEGRSITGLKANLRRKLTKFNRNNFTKFQKKRGHGGKRKTQRRKTKK